MPDYTINDVIRFARQRHRAYLGREVTDPIVQTQKFTNVFRVLDRGSQYLLRLMNVYEDPRDRVALSYFYRQVNRPDTMDAIIAANEGFVPDFEQITDPAWYDDVIQPVVEARPGAFLNGAYIILIKPGDSRGTVPKMREMFPGAADHLARVADEGKLATRVALLQKTPGLGPFLAMQIATDMGYCEGEPDQENTFVLAGPGSRKGVGFLLGKTSASPAEAQRVISTFPVDKLPPLPRSNGRPASWMDIQNVFCEFSKYARFKNQGRVGKQPYQRKGKYRVKIPSQFVLED
ncbi:hypothetical protein SEA_SIRVICTOR_55 [Microbacterium phage SirVictor]|nr:hypothetical protein SEA_SIRVICTOR_55 [Microbacterium phage SirVictor]WNM74398.1 hypothetical protein SEA_GUETZIE_55 [Microbacterium phage Guetzie]